MKAPGLFRALLTQAVQIAQGTLLVADLKTARFLFLTMWKVWKLGQLLRPSRGGCVRGQPEPREVRGGTASFLLQHTFLLTDGPSISLY